VNQDDAGSLQNEEGLEQVNELNIISEEEDYVEYSEDMDIETHDDSDEQIENEQEAIANIDNEADEVDEVNEEKTIVKQGPRE